MTYDGLYYYVLLLQVWSWITQILDISDIICKFSRLSHTLTTIYTQFHVFLTTFAYKTYSYAYCRALYTAKQRKILERASFLLNQMMYSLMGLVKFERKTFLNSLIYQKAMILGSFLTTLCPVSAKYLANYCTQTITFVFSCSQHVQHSFAFLKVEILPFQVRPIFH